MPWRKSHSSILSSCTLLMTSLCCSTLVQLWSTSFFFIQIKRVEVGGGGGAARPLHQLDVGSLLKLGHHNLRTLAMVSVLEETVGTNQGHEEFQLFVKQLAIPDTIHHLSIFLRTLAPLTPPAIAVPNMTLGRCLTIFLMNCGTKWSASFGLPATQSDSHQRTSHPSSPPTPIDMGFGKIQPLLFHARDFLAFFCKEAADPLGSSPGLYDCLHSPEQENVSSVRQHEAGILYQPLFHEPPGRHPDFSHFPKARLPVHLYSPLCRVAAQRSQKAQEDMGR